MAAIIANTGAQTWNTNAAWVGGVQPTAADDVTIPATSTVTIPTTTTALGRSCTVAASGTLVFATTTSVLTLGDATAGAGSVAFSNAGTITLTGIGTINFISTSATVQTITSGAQTLPNLTFNSASNGSYSLSDGLTLGTTTTLTLTKGALTTNAQTCSWGVFSSNNGNTRSMDITNSTITLSGNPTVWDFSNMTGVTFTSTGSTLNCTGAAPIVRGQSVLAGQQPVFHNINYTALTGTTASVFYVKVDNLTFTSTANKTATISWTEVTVNTLLTCNANSTTNRIQWTSAHGPSSGNPTPAVITAAAVSLSNVDFMDITGAGAATWTGTSMGDAGGNSGITFTVAATQTWSGDTTGTWSTAANWTSRVPLPQDNVIINALATGTVTGDMPRLGKSIDLTGSTGGALTLSTTNYTLYGSLTLVAAVTLNTTQAITFAGRGVYTLTSAGKSFDGALQFSAPGGTLTLQDNLTNISSVNINSGTLTATTQNVSCSSVTAPNTVLRTLNMGSGTWTVTSTGTVWSCATVTNFTLNANTSTIAITDTSVTGKTFAGGGLTYNNLTISGAVGAAAVTMTGANTFNRVTGAANAHLTLPSSTTTTINSLTSSGSAGALFVLDASTGGTAATLKSTNIIGTDFLSVKDSTASGCIPFYAGANGTLVSGDTNWSAIANPNPTNLGATLGLVGVG